MAGEKPKRTWTFVLHEEYIRDLLEQKGLTAEQIEKLDFEDIADSVLNYIDQDINTNYVLAYNTFVEENSDDLPKSMPLLDADEPETW